LLVESRAGLAAYEVKFSKTPAAQWATAMHRLAEEAPLLSQTVLSLCPETVPLAPPARCCPWWSFVTAEP